MNTKIRYLQGFLVASLCFLFIPSALALEGPKSSETAKEMLFFRNEGAFSPFRFVEMLIRVDGSGLTKFERYNEETGKVPFHLNQYEIEALKTLVQATDFFSYPDEDTSFATDVGKSTLRVSLGDKQRELHFRYRPEIRPLTSYLWRLINQGVILTDLRNKEDIYSALGALSAHHASAKVLQSKVLREPLEEFVRRSEDRQKLLWAIEALSWVMTPEEWMGFLSTELDRSKDTRRSLLLKALSSHPFTGNIPRFHRETLSSFFLKYLRLEYRNWSQFPKEKRQAYGAVVRFLGEQRYTVAIPVLVAMIQESYTDGAPWIFWSLPQMAGAAIEPLELLLDSSEAKVRAAAAEMLGRILTMNPNWPKKGSISEKEQERILKVLRISTLPRLEKLTENDPDDGVRRSAKRSCQQIQRGWNK